MLNWKRVLGLLRGDAVVERLLLRVRVYHYLKAKYEAKGNATSSLKDAPTKSRTSNDKEGKAVPDAARGGRS